MSIDITQISSELEQLILSKGISGNLITLVYGPQGEEGPQGVEGTAGFGLPTGGLSGSIIVKGSTFDYDTYWANLSLTSGLISDVYINSPSDGQALVYDLAGGYFTNKSVSGSSSSSSSNSTSVRITQASHGLTNGDAVYFDGVTWKKALANSTSTLGIGLVSYLTVNSFDVVFSGLMTNLSGLSSGNYHFVSESISGGLTTSEPNISNPLLFATSATSGIIIPWRPSVNTATSLDDYVNITTSYTASSSVDSIFCNAASATFSVYLPSPSTSPGKKYFIKKIDVSTNYIRLQPIAGNIEGSTSFDITGSNYSFVVGNNSSNWYILSQYRT